MGLKFDPDSMTAPKAPPAPPAFTPAPKPEDTEPMFQPSLMSDASIGDGVRNTIPLTAAEGWTRPASDLTFTMRQLTLGEHCQAVRMAAPSAGEPPETAALHREYVIAAVRSIGDNAQPSGADITTWIEDIGIQGWQYVWRQFQALHSVNVDDLKRYEASRRSDVVNRRFTYRLPAAIMPRKRWHSRTMLDARWVADIDPVTLVDRSHWTVRSAAGTYEPAPTDIADKLDADLTFTFKEARQSDSSLVADLAEDPDDNYAVRQLNVMHALCNIGGRELTNGPADLAFKRRWLEDTGPRANLLVTGTWVRLHEVDHGKIASFLDGATPLD